MEDIIFERDYTAENETAYEEGSVDILEQSIVGGFFERFYTSLKQVPKIIVPEYKADYDHLLNACDVLAKQSGGTIRGVVSYQLWEAVIELLLPHAEFATTENLLLLKDIAEKAQSVIFSTTETGKISLRLYVHYFEDLISDSDRNYLEYTAIMQDPKLVELIKEKTEISPELQLFADFLIMFLYSVAQATELDYATIFDEFLNRMGNRNLTPETFFEQADEVAQEIIDKYGDEQS